MRCRHGARTVGATNGARLSGPALTTSILLAALLLGGCTIVQALGARNSMGLSARPNPVRVAPGVAGTTTISWNVGGGWGEVWVVLEEGGPEILFAGGRSGSQDAPWIFAPGSYEFRLYTPQRERLLATIVVWAEPTQ